MEAIADIAWSDTRLSGPLLNGEILVLELKASMARLNFSREDLVDRPAKGKAIANVGFRDTGFGCPLPNGKSLAVEGEGYLVVFPGFRHGVSKRSIDRPATVKATPNEVLRDAGPFGPLRDRMRLSVERKWYPIREGALGQRSLDSPSVTKPLPNRVGGKTGLVRPIGDREPTTVVRQLSKLGAVAHGPEDGGPWLPIMFDSINDGVGTDARQSRPLRDAFGLAVDRNIDVVAAIGSLLLFGRPPNIIGRIPSVIVDAVETHVLRPRSHVLTEVPEVVPALAYCESPSAVVPVRSTVHVVAPDHHVRPRHRNLCVRLVHFVCF